VPEKDVGLLAKNYAIAQGRVIESAEQMDDAHFARSMGTRVHSVAWQVWHIARWDDRYAEILVEKTPELADRFGPPEQIWAAESLAKQWGLPIGHMGRRDTGTEMDDESADALRLPETAVVVDYARRVFARLQGVINALRQAGDPPTRVDVNPRIGRFFAQTRHQLDVAGERHDESSAGRWIDVADRKGEAARPTLQRGIMRER
jgi:hypothetical protein